MTKNNYLDSFIFALILTLIAAVWALFAVDAGPVKIAEAWYKGFWILLKFAMQMVLILATGYAIALSPIATRLIDQLSGLARSPGAVAHEPALPEGEALEARLDPGAAAAALPIIVIRTGSAEREMRCTM